MKRNLLLLAVMFVAVLLFTSQSWAQCSEEPNDLGICDTIYIETFNCDHQYTMGGIFDSVRTAIYVTHDSNTFYWQQISQWVQDSVAAFVIPLNFFDVGCADSVVLPTYGRWNNTKYGAGWEERTIWRNLVDDHTGITTYNRMHEWHEVGEVADWTPTVDMEGVATDTDSGHYFMSLIPVAGDCRRWYEGNKVLLMTLTFLIYGLSPDPGCDTSLICIDSTIWPPTGHLAFTRYDAVNYTPRHFLRECDTIFIPPNMPPECTQFPGDKTHNLDGTYTSDQFTNYDPDGQVVLVTAYVLPAGQGIGNLVVHSNAPGQTVTGTVDYDVTDHCQPGPYQICIVCTDDKGAKDTCCFNVDLTNHAPTIDCPDDVEHRWDAPFVSDDFSTDDLDGDVVTVVIDGVDPTPNTMPDIKDSHVEWTATEAETCITYTITLKVTDRCGATATCTFTFHAIAKPGCGAVVTIGCPEANPGEAVDVPIMLNASNPIGGFELEVEFDYVDLCFISAERGGLIDDMVEDLYDWEYFTYRLLPCNAPPCQKYKILLYGQADLPNNHTGVVIPASTTSQELVVLKFQVAFNELLRGYCIPVKFEFKPYPLPLDCGYGYDWDCAENTLSDDTGDRLFASDDLTKFNRYCCHQELLGEICAVHFTDGCVCIPTVSPTTCKRGDVNYNHMQYEVADAVLFARYFVYGIGVFNTDPVIRAYQICATDVNADGRPLMLADLIYLVRVIQRDAVAIPKLGPSSDVAHIVISEGRISVECASAIGGLLFEYEGAVTPTLLSYNMEILANESKVLVWSSEGNSINAGVSEVVAASGELVSVIAVDREGRELATTITTKVAPSAFALHPAYPNPFNPYTTLSFTLPSASAYSVKIYNVAGQLVRSYEGMGQTGLNVITWEGKDNLGDEVASGIYFYKLVAEKQQAIKKMIMMK